ncbi:beta galactosidase jelly roll domain-containing protein [Enterococcus sp. MJM12]|uniref:Beta galactosidase jelly roll domain-containing protein n=1 Tax=Candidatus Enterococcus myersii TaxID=2815322 RepID=A0ABS3H5N8_9ENTE|nr:sugar-binding domain-containing protein [Enterococcus sp. MJM12]MBO0448304.1 beta galactosidase jelly roll domain-containing protein [Enterococcus sp. MJM12]
MLNRKEHPRPQLIRKKWQSLDGKWDFAFDDNNIGLIENWFKVLPAAYKILVPFTYETELSGIHDTSHHKIVWYQRTFENDNDENQVLYFEGVDFQTQVWLNGHLLGTHKDGYERFSFDLQPYLTKGTNTITLRVEDSLSCEQPRGKQRWLKDNFGCWYVQTTGIWKSVWLEEAGEQRINYLKLTPELDLDLLKVEVELKDAAVLPESKSYYIEAEASFKGELISYHKGLFHHNGSNFTLDTRVKENADSGTQRWSPHTPNLYDLTVRLYTQTGKLLDEVYSYFGMRKLSIENGQILLNNRQLYQRLILDQGYWPESGITPPSVAALEKDLEKISAMGYNGLRKHQKIEDERFLYLCDEKGILVWAEMPSTYVFNDIAIAQFTKEWLEIVKQHYNHPAVITWVPFNESWGIKGVNEHARPQHFTEGIYHLTKAIDPNRPVITNDGWEHTISDILTLHDYEETGLAFAKRYSDQQDFATHGYSNKEKIINNEIQFNDGWFAFAKGFSYKGQPIMISEFGGIAFTADSEDQWGYGNQVKNETEFMERFEKIHAAIQSIPYITGFCYTQLTDVEQEVNGLLTADRKDKVDLTKVKEINERRINFSEMKIENNF